MEKKIEVLNLKAGDIKTTFGNPRKISKKSREELKKSLENYGDFGIFLVNENMEVIAGNMRLSIIKEQDPETVITVKKLIGYSEAELRAINIKDNTHAGIWDLDLLADWTADLNIDLGLESKTDPNERSIKEMELIHYEKYDYVLIACRNELDYNELTRKLGIDGKKVSLAGGKRKIKARAIWFDEMKASLVEKK